MCKARIRDTSRGDFNAHASRVTANKSEPLLPYECHEGNYGLRNILSAARAEDGKAGRQPER
jgi:hypothetical protein